MTKNKQKDGTVSSEVQGDMDSLEQTVTKIEKYLEPFFKASLRETKENLSGLEVAKLNIVIAYAINTLFYMYLKTQGVSPNEHPVKTELERVRLYIKKVKELTEKENPQKQTLKLNAEAAQRFISHALGDTLADQRGKENKEPEKDTKREKDNKSKEDQKEKTKNKKEENTVKSNKRQSPDKVTAESTDKKKRRK